MWIVCFSITSSDHLIETEFKHNLDDIDIKPKPKKRGTKKRNGGDGEDKPKRAKIRKERKTVHEIIYQCDMCSK